MSLVIDIILLGILVVAIIFSAKKGIVRTVLEIAAFVLTLVLAAQIAAPAAKTLYSSFLSERVEDKIADTLSESEAATNTKKAAAVMESLPGFAQSYLAKTGVLPENLAPQIATGNMDIAETAAYLNTKIAQPICETVLTGILFLLFCVAFSVILQFLAGVISRAFELPVVKTANAALGAVFGAIKGCVIIYIAVALLVFIAPRSSGGQFRQAVNDSRIVSFTEQYLPESVFGEWI